MHARSKRSSSSQILLTTTALILVSALAPACGGGSDDLFPSTSSTSGSPTGTGGEGASSGTGGEGAGDSTSSTGTPPTEDCTDGADNDLDGQIDCADTDCGAGFECVDEAPEGWSGHYRVTQGAWPSAVPSCAGGESATPFYAGPAGPPECGACACGPHQGLACALPELVCFPGSSVCSGAPVSWTAAFDDGDCHKPSNLLGGANALSCAVIAPASVASKGACAPSGGGLSNEATWQSQLAACGGGPAGKGCDAGKTCVPKGSGDPDESLCVRKDGHTSCPDGWSEVAQVFTGGQDTRSCAACGCDVTASCSGGSYTFHDLDQCGDSDPPVPIDSNACTGVSALLDSGTWSAKATLPQGSASCAVTGGQASGELTTTGPVTFCCK